jgi:hypothetical protein
VIHNTTVLSFAGSVFRAVAIGLLGLFLVTSIPPAAVHTGTRVVQAVVQAGEGSAGAWRRVHGEDYVAAIERIRRTIPRDGEYLIVNGAAEWQGGPYWVRFDLAPRRARYLGLLSEMTGRHLLGNALAERLAAGPRWVVVAYADRQPPLLIEREAFRRQLLRQSEAGRGPG